MSLAKTIFQPSLLFYLSFRYNYDIATPYLSRGKNWVYKMLDEQISKNKHRGKYMDSEKFGSVIKVKFI